MMLLSEHDRFVKRIQEASDALLAEFKKINTLSEASKTAVVKALHLNDTEFWDYRAYPDGKKVYKKILKIFSKIEDLEIFSTNLEVVLEFLIRCLYTEEEIKQSIFIITITNDDFLYESMILLNSVRSYNAANGLCNSKLAYYNTPTRQTSIKENLAKKHKKMMMNFNHFLQMNSD